MEYPKFKVCCRCLTFNQAKYITDAMNGFTMQQTSFPFVCTIVDDASTDGEQEVIKQYVEDNFDFSEGSAAFNKETDYAHITYAQHNTNKNCYFAVLYLKENHYSQRKSKMGYLSEWRDMCEYEALCEGDDYWIDSSKLQCQNDALDKNPECTIAYCRVSVISTETKKELFTIPWKNSLCSKNIVTLEDLMNEEYYKGHWTFHTSSFLFRKEYSEKYLELKKTLFQNFPYGDMPMQLTCLLNGNGYLIHKKMSCYRFLSGGYNSMLKANPQIKIEHSNKLIKAYNDLDNYTNNIYHKQIVRHILRAQFNIDHAKTKRVGLFRLKFKYRYFWGIETIKQIIKEVLILLKIINSK